MATKRWLSRLARELRGWLRHADAAGAAPIPEPLWQKDALAALPWLAGAANPVMDRAAAAARRRVPGQTKQFHGAQGWSSATTSRWRSRCRPAACRFGSTPGADALGWYDDFTSGIVVKPDGCWRRAALDRPACCTAMAGGADRRGRWQAAR